MAKRDLAKTARNKEDQRLTEELESLLPAVISIADAKSVHVLNARIGGKYQDFANVKEACIRSDDELVALYLDGLMRTVQAISPHVRQESAFYDLAKLYREHLKFREYTELFIKRTFLRNYEELTKVKPRDEDARLWIGENDSDYGLLVTPRFNADAGDWENDKSEIRKFKPNYFTIGHVLQTGLVVPGKNRIFRFKSVAEYLVFFQDTLVRPAGSVHQNRVAERYATLVSTSDDPSSIPLLIPELRYLGRERLHKHRLDFCIIDPFTLKKIGFELSPWSTHGRLKNTKKRTAKAVNEEAKGNFEKEIRKLEAYFREKGIHVTVFTDSDLALPDELFGRIAKYLSPEKRPVQLMLHARQQLLDMDLDAQVDGDS